MDEEFQISYSDKYHDDYYDYIIVYLTENTYHKIPPERRGYPLREPEWRSLGIKLFKGWINYDSHYPEPYILFFRKKLDYRLMEKIEKRKLETQN